jgi:D-3-phosphoglycerate dehydrogenase
VGSPTDTPEDIASRLREFRPDGIIVRQGKITAGVQEAAGTLRVICKHGVGTDNIDIGAATRRGIPVMFTPSANFESVAEHTLALILCLIRRLRIEDKRIRSGVFEKAKYDGLELGGKSLGVVGFGRVGRRLSELAAPFRLNVVVYHPSRTVEVLPRHISKAQALEELYAQADILSLHCPLTPDTRGMIDARALARMKRGVYLVNTARGGIVNETDLLHALQEGRVAGAALDVFEVEPPPPDHPLLRMDNVIFTTHIAGVSDNSYRNMGMDSVRNVLAVLRGESLDMESVVNREVRAKG